MNRLVFSIEIAATLAVTAYVLIASVQTPGHPAVSAGELAAYVAAAFAAFVAGLALYVAARLGGPRALCRCRRRAVQWAARRAVRRLARERARRMRRRHAARIGDVR